MKRLLLFSILILCFVLPCGSFNGVILVQGSVCDEQFVPIPGASVYQKNSQKGVLTDVNGNFSLKLSGSPELIKEYSELGYYIVATAIGYSVEVVPVRTNDPVQYMTIRLKENY